MLRPLTHAPIGRTLVHFSLPLWGGYVLQSLNTSVNAFWIGRHLGEAALSAAVHANNLLFVLIALVFGISQATNLLVARAVGANRWALARRITGTSASLFLCLLLYLPFVVIDLIVSNILLAMGMMMVSPVTIAWPFKLMLFVLVDGWTLLLGSLVQSFYVS